MKNMDVTIKTINDTEKLIKLITKGAATISDKKVKGEVEKWVADYSSDLFDIFGEKTKENTALLYLRKSWIDERLNKKRWLKNLKIILKGLKNQQIAGLKRKKISKYQKNYIFSSHLLKKIRKQDKKIFVLGFETNVNWQTDCWNACGILMRLILERVLDKKDNRIKQITGLDPKINYCLSNKIFGKTILGALKKLQHSTKITGDIVAQDSNILLDRNDIEISIVPLNMLIKEVFKL